MSWAMQLVIALAIFAGGLATGIKWHAGQDAIAAEAAREARASDMRRQARAADAAGVRQAARVDLLNGQLGNAREEIAKLSGRPCLSGDTVRMLNNLGNDVPAPAAQPASAPAASATDRDIGRALAICRTGYAAIAGQLNEIIDLDDKRHAGQEGAVK